MIESNIVQISKLSTSFGVEIEQKPVNNGKVSTDDIIQMLALVSSGISAKQYIQDGCESYIEGNRVFVNLQVFVWPTDIGVPIFPYINIGEIGPHSYIEMEREFDVICDYNTHIPLPFLTTKIETEWQTPCYNKGKVVNKQDIGTLSNRILTIESGVFGVIRVKCTAIGYSYKIILSFDKDSDHRISSISPIFTVKWRNGENSESKTLDIPRCAEQLLQVCPDDKRFRSNRPINMKDEKKKVRIYYSRCDGKVKDVVYV